jgi:hypothetical protein
MKDFFRKSLLPLLLSLVVISCSNQKESAVKLSAEDEKIKIKGERLVQKYCSSCHAVVDPNLLDKKSWHNVLYQMHEEIGKTGGVVDYVEWEMIERYYNRFSNSILDDSGRHISTRTTRFDTARPASDIEGSPNITVISFNPDNGSLVVGDASRRLIYRPSDGETRIISLENIPINIKYGDDEGKMFVLGIGNLRPSETMSGQLLSVDIESGEAIPLIDGIERPVQFAMADLNNDGVDEFLISCFGSTTGKHNTGRLLLYSLEDETWKKRVLENLPGATKAIVEDYNHDGLADIFAMFAQGNERIVRYTNLGGLQFSAEILVEYPPVYGISDFALADMDGDERKDLVITNGDNGDFSPVFKPYHGVRILFGNEDYTFTQGYFQKINGAGRLRVRDFDDDGDLDVVVLSIYPDLFRFPEETLVYLENNGEEFEVRYFEKEPTLKWTILEAGDIDGDGDEDILTGANNMLSFPIPKRFSEKFKTTTVPVSVFENTLQ